MLSHRSLYKDEAADFTAGGESDYTAWQWYWDGEAINGETSAAYALAANSQPPGIYELSVVVTDGTGRTLAARCRVTIKDR